MKRKYLSPEIKEVDITKGQETVCGSGSCAGGKCLAGVGVANPQPSCGTGGSACWCSTGTAEVLN